MGYACPVCGAPQRDAEHLANHLAFTAMLHGDGHEAWLDDHAPDWADADPDALGERVAPHAEETAYDEVFEDTADHGRGRPFDDAGAPGAGAGAGRRPTADDGPVDEATRAALAEARELTREMLGSPGGDEGDADDAGSEAGDEGDADDARSGAGDEGDEVDEASDAEGDASDGEEKA